MQTWAEVLESGILGDGTEIGFDIAATVTRHPAEENELIAEIIRRIGTSRFYIGSDWPAFNKPRWVALNFKNQVPLTDEEMTDVLDNIAPYFK
jgi:predicted TIM-barrel fold metal-dependent hydrolase